MPADLLPVAVVVLVLAGAVFFLRASARYKGREIQALREKEQRRASNRRGGRGKKCNPRGAKRSGQRKQRGMTWRGGRKTTRKGPVR